MRGAAAAGPVLGEQLQVAGSAPTFQELWRQNVGRQSLPVLILQVEVEGPEHGTDLCAGGVRRARCSLGRGGLGQGYQQHPGRTCRSSSSQSGPPRGYLTTTQQADVHACTALRLLTKCTSDAGAPPAVGRMRGLGGAAASSPVLLGDFAPCLPSAVLVFLGSFAIVFFRLAALAAFRTFFPAVAFCLAVGIITPQYQVTS